MGGRADPVVPVPAEVAVTPEQRPRGMRRRVPESGDRETAPVGSNVGAPRRTALDDRDRGALDLDLEADLMPGVRWHAGLDEPSDPGEVELRDLRSGGHGARLPSDRVARQARRGRIRYALYRSYVLLRIPPIEPISEQLPDQIPLGKPQRFDGEAYESPALPLSYSATGRPQSRRIGPSWEAARPANASAGRARRRSP